MAVAVAAAAAVAAGAAVTATEVAASRHPSGPQNLGTYSLAGFAPRDKNRAGLGGRKWEFRVSCQRAPRQPGEEGEAAFPLTIVAFSPGFARRR